MRLSRAAGRNPERYVVFDADVFPHKAIATFWNPAEAFIFEHEFEKNAEKFCDENCTWLDHHPACYIGGLK